ncbi:MAG: Crp/Fnr family transcriptional regulator [Sporocytophaga sp.]|uniref:Crp/Fnr family transcriptional regulator n=1 Tax=Sporocytophaga sp. TaxID=2231183 RepID=UPI001B23CF34|nr:Crp/Fnr family transcriptional regulator [Sporocytophaga sp.]MBO9703148.1 Crp/Fnr family transcriptional regulator [Sporocytophaga sp.]
MNTQLFQNINKTVSLSKEEFEQFYSYTQTIKLKRKEFLLSEGDTCKHSYFVSKGCLRYFYSIEGNEHTGQFFFENNWYTDLESFLTGKPSRQNIEALEPTQIITISKDSLEKLYMLNPKFERFGRLMAERAFIGIKQRTEMLTNQSAEERYINLIRERPKVIERIPQHYIASYIGIQPQSLSRIRKKLGNY